MNSKKVLLAGIPGLILVCGLAVVLLSAVGLVGGVASNSGAVSGFANSASYSSAAYFICDPGGDLYLDLPTGRAYMSDEQMGNAAIIVEVGKQLNISEYGLVIALATALQESTLHNRDVATDHDSLGLFQQRPSQGWGTPAQILDPRYASRKFFEKLVTIPGWESMSVTQAAQAVQRSAFPNAYAKWEPLARAILGRVDGITCAAIGDSDVGNAVVNAAMRWLGTPYVWAGGDANGPTKGDGVSGLTGFDCSGLALYAWAQVGVSLPHYADSQADLGSAVPRGQEQPGDLLFFHNSKDPKGFIHHVGIYIGGGKMVHAPTFGKTVMVVDVFGSNYWMPEYVGARRYAGRIGG